MKEATGVLVGFLLAVIIMAFSSSKPSYQLVESQPAKPKQVLVETWRSHAGLVSDMETFIETKTKEGWIVKSVAIMEDESTSKGIVVLEKY